MIRKSNALYTAFVITFSVAATSFAYTQCPKVGMVTIDLDTVRPSTEPVPFLFKEQWPHSDGCKITHVEFIGSNLKLDSTDENIAALQRHFAFLSTRLAPLPKIALRVPFIFQGTPEEVTSKANVLLKALRLESAEIYGLTSERTSIYTKGQTQLAAASICGLLFVEAMREQDSTRKLRLSGAFAACASIYGIVHSLRSSTNSYIQAAIEPAECSIPALVGVYSGTSLGAIVYPFASAYCWLRNTAVGSSYGVQVCARGEKFFLRSHPTSVYLTTEFLTQELSRHCKDTIGG